MLLRLPDCRHGSASSLQQLRRQASSRGRPRAEPRGQPCAAAGRGENDKHARAEQVLQQRTAKALDASLATITRLIGVGDMYGGVGSSRPALPPGEAGDAAAFGGAAKRVSFRCRAKTKRQVAQAASERLFCDYLSLPAEEYSLLDPSWVARVDDCTFRFTVPLGTVLAELSQGAPVPGGLLKLEPAITVRTELDRTKRTVVLRGSDATLGLGGSGIEKDFTLSFQTTLTWSGGPDRGASGDAAPAWGLACAVDVQGSIGLGQPLAKLPGPLLGAFTSLMGTAVAQAVLPRFAETLAEDYGRWALGKDRFSSSGALLAAPQTEAVAVEVEVLPPQAGDAASQ